MVQNPQKWPFSHPKTGMSERVTSWPIGSKLGFFGSFSKILDKFFGFFGILGIGQKSPIQGVRHLKSWGWKMANSLLHKNFHVFKSQRKLTFWVFWGVTLGQSRQNRGFCLQNLSKIAKKREKIVKTGRKGVFLGLIGVAPSNVGRGCHLFCFFVF